MKKLGVFILTLLLLLPEAIAADKPAAPAASVKPVVYFFYSPHCGACHRVKEDILPGLQREYSDKVTWQIIDVSQPTGGAMLNAACANNGCDRPVAPSFLVGRLFIGGVGDIQSKLNDALAAMVSGRLDPADAPAR